MKLHQNISSRKFYHRIFYIIILSLFTFLLVKFVVKFVSSYQNACVDNIFENILPICLEMETNFEKNIPVLGVVRARYDDRRLIRIYNFHYIGKKWEYLVNKYNICFATQTSIERMYWLPYVLQQWTGPLSLSVYLTSEEEWLIFNLYLCYMAQCHSNYLSRVTIHLAVPTNISHSLRIDQNILDQWPNLDTQNIFQFAQDCPKAKTYLDFLLESFPTLDSEKLKLKEIYPQNHMRNIARKSCGTDWTFSADIDIIPCNGAADMMQQFYENIVKNPCEKCAFVIPTFELNESYPFPENKPQVVDYFNEDVARQFHGKLYRDGHKFTDYERWVSTNIEDSEVKISHQILDFKNASYEPFYISADHIPPFDERILGYGFTRNSQFKAANYAGWKFTVLTPVFSIHWGIQTNESVISPKKDGTGENVRREQVDRNFALILKILKEYQLKKELDLF